MGEGDAAQLVSYYLKLFQFHNAETGPEDFSSVYHQIQGSPGSTSSGLAGGPALPALGHAIAGSMATAGSKLLVYPIELVTTRLQVQRQLRGPKEAPSAARGADAEYKSFIDGVQKIYKNEGGLRAFYTGCTPDVGKGIADSFLFFLAYTFLRQHQLRRDGTKDLSIIKELSVGVVAGSFAKLVTTPLQNIITRQQTAALVAARDPSSETTPSQSDKLSVKDIALQIRSERGIAGFWAGYSASTILTLNPAITFAVENTLKSLLPKSRREKPSPQLTFLLAAISKAIATSLTYPVMLAKSRAQAVTPTPINDSEGTEKDAPLPAVPGVTIPDAEPSQPSSEPKKRKAEKTARPSVQKLLRLLSAQYAIALTLRKIYREEGLSGLYSGIEGEVLKGFLSHGLTMMVKEKVHVGVIQMYYMLLRLTKRWPAEAQKMQTSAQAVAADAKERVGNVSVTVAEGAKQLAEEGKKAVGA
ncbi:hypothetical protein B0A55_03988 [Friedmanniomyces simplex]|uniref:Peroxisomal adenine nucleotide transporter 1 n=1 Tax=Friedmanniomyces simplex TaxID=329884 RepID=A0A4U0XK71_9PEZI|nr:hypothetical protein B0A55_03988 [Friedmanniomyces simplex]